MRLSSAFNSRRLLLAAAVLIGVGAILLWRLLPRDSTTQVTSDQAQAEFQRLVNEEPSRTEMKAGSPEPGVYRYSVTGGEHLDALLSAAHDYSGVTNILVVSRACGFEEEWRMLRERWTSTILCPDSQGDLELKQLREYHEFFGTVNDVLYHCRPIAAEATRCSSPSGSISYSTHRLGMESINIAGRHISAVHLSAHAVFSGESTGAGAIEEWRRASDGLLLRKNVSVRAQVASAENGEYGESYQLILLEPDPT